MIAERHVLLGSSTSSSAEAGSPRMSEDILRRLIEQEQWVLTPTLVKFWISLPGIEANVRSGDDRGFPLHHARRPAPYGCIYALLL